MADLLECLLQIKGLRETLGRVAALAREPDETGWRYAGAAGGATALDVLSRIVASERLHGKWLRLMLGSSKPALPPPEAPGVEAAEAALFASVSQARDVFCREREANLEVLDRCSADDLSRTGVAPGRHAITVADLVAVMLAGDMDHLGAIRRALEEARRML